MAEIIIDATRYIDVFPEVNNDKYYVALIGGDGTIIQGSRLSSNFDAPSAAFAVLETMKSKHPNAGVFFA
jgi:NAD kinase